MSKRAPEENLTALLQNIHDEADHILGTGADYHKEVAFQNAREIKKLAKRALHRLEKETARA